MQEDTAQKILSDPDFNPAGIWADALMAYLKINPIKVASDAVAMKYLIQDPAVAPHLINLIDINDTDRVRTCLKAVSKCDANHLIWGAARDFWEQQYRVKLDNQQTIEDIIVENIGVFSEVEVLSENRHRISDNIIKALANSEFKPHVDRNHKAWAFLTRYVSGALVFVDAAKYQERAWWMHAERKKMAFYKEQRKFYKYQKSKEEWEKMRKATPVSPFQNFSTAAATLKHSTSRAEVIGVVKNLWPNHYLCFKCGKGSGTNRSGHIDEKKQLKSKSGYSIHRKKCDPDNEFPSPHEIFFGEERDLEFACKMCGATFTTASGKTLHEKRCWVG